MFEGDKKNKTGLVHRCNLEVNVVAKNLIYALLFSLEPETLACAI